MNTDIADLVFTGNFKAVELFVENAPMKTIQGRKFPDMNWNSGLYAAAFSGNKEMIRYFILHGADLKAGLIAAEQANRPEIKEYIEFFFTL